MIPIIIPLGVSHTCSVSGTRFKIVQCEHCRFVYVYRMERSATGTAQNAFFLMPEAPVAAQAEASVKLQDLASRLRFLPSRPRSKKSGRNASGGRGFEFVQRLIQ